MCQAEIFNLISVMFVSFRVIRGEVGAILSRVGPIEKLCLKLL